MVAHAALFLLALSGTADGATFEASPWLLDVQLRSPLLEGGRHRLIAQAATRGSDASPAPSPATAQSPRPVTPPPAESAEGQCAQCDVDCDTCHESERLARYLTRRRERNLRVHRGFALAAWGGLLVTEVFGTILAINRPTWAGGGNCTPSGEGGIFGTFGCGSGLVALHETFAFVTTGLYITSGVIAATAPDPDNASVGDDPASRGLRLHKALVWAHGAGMILLPILGILAASPELVGVEPADARDFQSAMRSVHAIVGYATFATFSLDAVLELL